MRPAVIVVSMVLSLNGVSAAQREWGNAAAIAAFQRAADSYAFAHRQAERQLGSRSVNAAELSAAIVASSRLTSGQLFTADVVEEFRSVAARAVHLGCDAGELRTGVWELLHTAGTSATGAKPIASCLARYLPQLPTELEYRSAGTVLLIVDAHANLVVDILPALLAGSDLR